MMQSTKNEKSTEQQKQQQIAFEEKQVTFLVVGGGIAGVSCAETLAICCPQESILLLTESSVVKTVANLEPVARYLHKFDVKEKQTLEAGFAPSIHTLVDHLESLDANAKQIQTLGGHCIRYKYICLCTGGRPRLIDPLNPLVLGIRDTDSVLQLQKRLQNAKRIVLLGNGGIASELAYELRGVEVHWVIKDNYISSTFVDAGAAHFFLQKSADNRKSQESSGSSSAIKRLRYDEHKMLCNAQKDLAKLGAALGPDWHRNFQLQGALMETAACPTKEAQPIIHYNANIQNLQSTEKTLCVTLNSGKVIEVDFLVSATGVLPQHDFTSLPSLKLATDGGIAVNELMQTNLPCVYAAGDVCTAAWSAAEHWFQMRLWTQARQMGCMAGRSMAAAHQGETIFQDFAFELFGHVTQLFGHQVVLLGRYNAQDLPPAECELLLRTTPGKEYIKFVLQNGRLRGAILIGNNELAETCENLILNGIDLTPFGDDILNPDIDIEDYFD